MALKIIKSEVMFYDSMCFIFDERDVNMQSS